MTDIEPESLIASLPAKTLDEIGVLASDAFVGHGMRDDGDSLVLLHGIAVYALRELAPLRALREAVDSLVDIAGTDPYCPAQDWEDWGNMVVALAAYEGTNAED